MTVFDRYIPTMSPMDAPGMSNVNLTEANVATAQLFGHAGLLLLYAGYALPIRHPIGQLLPAPR